MKKVLVNADFHYPYYSKIMMSLTKKFIKKFKPDIFILLGDQLDFDIISHWTIEDKRSKEGRRLKKEYDNFNEKILKPIEKYLPKKCKKYWFEGNHEDWIEQLLDKYPEFEGLLEHRNYLKLKERGWKIIEINDHIKLGKCNFTHGFDGGLHHAAKMVNAYEGNIVYAHWHTLQTHTKLKFQDNKDFHSAFSTPAMCDLKLNYLKKKPSRWVNGLGIGHIMDDGEFNYYPVVVATNKFCYGGVTYKA